MIASSTNAGDSPSVITKIIGIGQTLRGDDAAGLAAVSLWQKTFRHSTAQPEIIVELVELPGIGLLSMLEGIDRAILVDAVRGGAKPGTIHTLTENQLESYEFSTKSAHGWGVAETLSLGRTLTPAEVPGELFLIGIEAVQLEMGENLSLEVEQALPRVARLIEQIVSAKPCSLQDQSASSRISPK